MVLMKVLLFLHNRQKWFGEKRHWAHRCMGYTDYAEGRRLTEGRMSLALFPLTPSLTPSWTPLHKPGTLQDKLTSATIPDISFTESITPVSLCWQWGLESSVSKAPNGVGIQRNWVAACFFFLFPASDFNSLNFCLGTHKVGGKLSQLQGQSTCSN